MNNSEKSTNLLHMIKNRLPNYLLQIFFYQFVNTFSALLLLCKINVINILNVVDFVGIFSYDNVFKF